MQVMQQAIELQLMFVGLRRGLRDGIIEVREGLQWQFNAGFQQQCNGDGGGSEGGENLFSAGADHGCGSAVVADGGSSTHSVRNLILSALSGGAGSIP